ncbi:MAG: histidine phosphatase family protein [Nostocoides sp.]
MGSPRRVIVLRHGETEHNAAGIWQGHLDSPLSADGEEQASAAAAVLAGYAPAVVAASDLSRARVTGQAVADAVGRPLVVDGRFREVHAGRWQGMSGDEVQRDYPEDMDRLMRGEDFPRGVTGETLADVSERCRAGVGDLLRQLPEGATAVIATHGVAGRAIVADLIGLTQSQAWTTLAGLGNCHWAEVTESRTGWRLQAWNVAVLAGASLPSNAA